jgi:CheY-like chemotaxis protein
MDQTPFPARRLSVLVVDDYPDAAGSLARLLGLLGYRVRVALGVEEALRAAAESPPDVVVMEVRLRRGTAGGWPGGSAACCAGR